MEAGYGVVNVDGTDCFNPFVNFHFQPLCPHIAIIIGIDVGNREPCIPIENGHLPDFSNAYVVGISSEPLDGGTEAVIVNEETRQIS